MSPQADLQTFIQVVPVCRHDAPIEALRFIFSQGNCEQVVIVNSEHHPLGIISLHRFLPYLLNTPQTPSPELQTPLRLNEFLSVIIEPMITVPSDLSLDEFWQYLQAQRSHPLLESLSPQPVSLALINKTGAFIGLINSFQVLQYLAKYPQKFTQFQQPRPSPNLELNSESQQRFNRLAQEKLTVYNHLIQFLDELPIPLMIQNDQGTIISQNLAWRSHIGQGSDVLQEVAESVTR